MPNPVVHWQIISKNPDTTAAFYRALFDWQVDDANAMGYRTIRTGGDRGIDGGVWPAPPQANAFVQLHVEVDDVDRYVQRATELGAIVLMPAQDLPEGERMAVLRDPEGVPFVVMQPTARG